MYSFFWGMKSCFDLCLYINVHKAVHATTVCTTQLQFFHVSQNRRIVRYLVETCHRLFNSVALWCTRYTLARFSETKNFFYSYCTELDKIIFVYIYICSLPLRHSQEWVFPLLLRKFLIYRYPNHCGNSPAFQVITDNIRRLFTSSDCTKP